MVVQICRELMTLITIIKDEKKTMMMIMTKRVAAAAAAADFRSVSLSLSLSLTHLSLSRSHAHARFNLETDRRHGRWTPLGRGSTPQQQQQVLSSSRYLSIFLSLSLSLCSFSKIARLGTARYGSGMV